MTCAANHKFITDALKLIFGNVGSYALYILATPMLARIYDPSDFGIFAIYFAAVQIVGSVTSLSFDLPVLNMKKRNDALVALSIGVAANVCCSLFFFMICMVISGTGIRFPEPFQTKFLAFVPPLVLLIGLGTMLSNWFVREKKFAVVSYSRFLNTLIMVGAQLLLGYLIRPDYSFLIAGLLLGSIASCSFLIIRFVRSDIKSLVKNVSIKKMITSAARNKNFPLFVTPAMVMNSISWQTPVFLLGYFFDAASTGLYSMGMRIIQVPMNLIGQSISQVVHQRTALITSEGIPSRVLKVYEALVNIMFLPSVILLLFGEELFSFVFGYEWRTAGLYVQILVPWAFVWFVSTPLGRLLYVFEKQRFVFVLNIIILVTRVISIYLGGVAKDPLVSIMLFSASGFLVYGYLNYSIMKYSGIRYGRVMLVTIQAVIRSLPFVIVLLLTKIFMNSILCIIVSILVVIAGYIIINVKYSGFINMKRDESRRRGM
jgi:lipopolysaccharide exporter